jgi:hypothetical protein
MTVALVGPIGAHTPICAKAAVASPPKKKRKVKAITLERRIYLVT